MNIFIEADSITTERLSGIGHTTVELIHSIEGQIKDTSSVLTLIIPFGKKSYIEKYKFKNVHIKTLPPGYKYVNYLLVRTSIKLPVDLVYGRGLYIFPNYKNWYVPFSKSFTFVHDVAYKIFPETIRPNNLKYLQKNMKNWLSRTTKIITISNSSKKDIIKFFPEYKDIIEVIHLGVDNKKFHKMNRLEIKTILKKYDIDDNYIVYVGNIEPRKNIEGLVLAYKKYCDNNANPAQLLLVGGGGWNDEKIKVSIQKLQSSGYNINWPKVYVGDEDLPAIYSGARALVHLSIYEGFGLSLIQAQACGLFVIASNLPVFKETTQPEMIKFVNYNDTDEIAIAIAEAVTNKVGPVNVKATALTWIDTGSRLLSLAGIKRNTDE